jgi:phospholipase C
LAATVPHGAAWAASPPGAAHPNHWPIKHVIIIMQENRSFDNYFGTFPGANGFPGGTCVPIDPTRPQLGCVMPFHDPNDVNAGGPHGAGDAQADLDDGITQAKMDGFVLRQTQGLANTCGDGSGNGRSKANCGKYIPGTAIHDVVGYHNAGELPNYWAYARNFVLQDQMYAGVRSWSMAAHLDLTSEWSAHCDNPLDVSTCTTSPNPGVPSGNKVIYPWVNLFQLLDTHQVSWKYYLGQGTEPDCDDDQMTCDPQLQKTGLPSYWNPAPSFAWVQAQGQAYVTAHNPNIDQFLVDIKNGVLPQVAWVVPAQDYSEHPVAGITAGQDYVTSLVNAVMQSPYWSDTAIFLSWDDWGGFYDHVVPPVVDRNDTKNPIEGFGLRVPGLLISAYARSGMIDHNVLSTDSYARFIETLFMDDTRLDPVQMGEPDSRPTIRDKITQVRFMNGDVVPVGGLDAEFDFGQKPLPPLILSTHIPIRISVACGSTDANNPQQCAKTTVTTSWQSVAIGDIKGPFTYQLLRDGAPVGGCDPASTRCTDSDVPAGTHYYTVYSIDRSNVASPASAAAEADVP